MHRGAYHFIKVLKIPSLMHTKKAICNMVNDDDDDNMYISAAPDDADAMVSKDSEEDIDVSMDIDASPDNVNDMIATTVVDLKPGNVIGKLLAFVNQV